MVCNGRNKTSIFFFCTRLVTPLKLESFFFSILSFSATAPFPVKRRGQILKQRITKASYMCSKEQGACEVQFDTPVGHELSYLKVMVGGFFCLAIGAIQIFNKM